MKFSSHGTYIRPNSVVEMAMMPDRVGLGNELPHAQAEDEQDEKAGFKIVHARRANRCVPMYAGHVQKSPDHQQHAADHARTI